MQQTTIFKHNLVAVGHNIEAPSILSMISDVNKFTGGRSTYNQQNVSVEICTGSGSKEEDSACHIFLISGSLSRDI
jgi:hypothetical protein